MPEADLRYDMAWYLIYVVAFDIGLNILGLLFSIVHKIYSALKNYFIRRKAIKAFNEARIHNKGSESKPQVEDGQR